MLRTLCSAVFRTRLRRRFTIVGAVCATTLALLTAAPATSAPANVALPTPLGDLFYATPDNIGDFENGDIVAKRKMPNPPNFFNIETWQVKFRTTDMYDRPITGITTLLLPLDRKANAPLLSFQDIVNSLGLECAPSRTLYQPGDSTTALALPALNGLLVQGWAIAIPDHLGPRSAYGAAELGGRITLDGIRSAKKLSGGDLSGAGLTGSRVGLVGYSGGGMATAWAAALASSYAPELELAGSAYGGTPMNLVKMAEGLGYNKPHPVFGLAYAAAVGLSREYPNEIEMWDNLTPLGKSIFVRMQNACINEILEVGEDHSADEMTPDVKIFDDPVARKVVQANSLDHYAGVPNAPVYEWHNPTDSLIPVDSIIETNARYCRAGVAVTSKKVPSGDHVASYPLGINDALDWLKNRFAGLPAPRTC